MDRTAKPRECRSGRRLSVRKLPVGKPKEESAFKAFLTQAAAGQHVSNLVANGFDDFETLLELSEEHLEDVKMTREEMMVLRTELLKLCPAGLTAGNGVCPYLSTMGKLSPADIASKEDEGGPMLTSKRPLIMTDAMHRLLTESWQQLRVDNCEQLGSLLSQHFFAQAPMSASTCGMDWSAVIRAIAFPIDRIDDLANAEKRLTRLGKNHARWQTQEYQFAEMKVAFVASLRDFFGKSFTTDLELAWSLLYDFVSGAMLDGLKEARAELSGC